MTLRRAGEAAGAGAYMVFGSLHDCMLHCETEYLKVRLSAGRKPVCLRGHDLLQGLPRNSVLSGRFSAGCGASWALWTGSEKHVAG